MNNTKKTLVAASLFALANTANAAYEIKLTDTDTITFGGYIKTDLRYVNGDVVSIVDDFWIGQARVVEGGVNRVTLSADETRFNTKYTSGDLTGFIELDFLTSAQGNQIVTNSASPRIRHAFVKYKNFLVGQTWTTFMNTSALAESANFGGTLNAAAFIRQAQIRYTNGNFQIALENPESDRGDPNQDNLPDLMAKYTFKGDWGNVSVAGLARKLNTAGGNSETAFGGGIAGRIKTFGKDDFRFQVHAGETGRYVGVVAARDLVGEEVEESVSVAVAYRHFWTETLRTNVFYGITSTDVADNDRIMYGINLFQNITPKLSVGFEVGRFDQDDSNPATNGDSFYSQLSAKYTL